MKTKIVQMGFLLLIATTLFSCKNALEDTLSKDIDLNNRTVIFTIDPSAEKAVKAVGSRVVAAEVVLYEGTLNINIADELEKNGFSFENVKSLLITVGTLEEEIPTGYDLKGFIGAKLYFEETSKLVARADKVEDSKVRFTIVNGELLDKLKEDNLYIILTGVRPIKKLKMKLTMNFKAKVSLVK